MRKFVYDDNGNPEVSYYVWTNGTSTKTVVERMDYNDDDRVTTIRRYEITGDVSTSLTTSGYVTYLNGQTPLTTTSTTYSDNGQVSKRTDEYGRDTFFDYDARGNLIRTLYPDKTEVRTAYDAMSRVEWQTDRYYTGATSLASPDNTTRARATKNIYDELGRVKEVQRIDGVVVKVENDPNTAASNVNRSIFDASASSLATVSIAKTIYDSAGRVKMQIGTGGQRTQYAYDAAGRVTSVTNELSQTTGYSYYEDSVNDKRWDVVTDALGHKARTDYDALGRVIKTTYDDDNDGAGDPDMEPADADDSFVETTYTYSIVGNDTVKYYRQRKSSEGAIYNESEYDLGGRLKAATLPNPSDPTSGTGRVRWEYGYDVYGNQTLQRDPLDNDLGGTQNRETTFAYDAQHRRTGRTLPGGQSESFAYDSKGRLSLYTDSKSQKTKYKYFESGVNAGRIDEKQYFTPSQNPDTDTPTEKIVYTYDNLGRIFTAKDYSGTTQDRKTTNTYDAEGRVTQIEQRVTPSETLESAVNYEYDAATGDRRRTYTSRTDTRYGYDVLGRLKAVAVNELNDTVLTHVLVTGYSYDAAGNLNTVTAPTGVVHDYDYDNLNRLDLLTVKKSNGNKLFEQDYTLTTDGQRDFAIEKRYDGSSGTPFSTNKVNWAYDGLNRLTEEVRDVGNNGPDANDYKHTYVLDKAGNRTSKSIDNGNNGSTEETITYTYDSNDRLTLEDSNVNPDTTYGYDANGSTISKAISGGATTGYQWDVRNRLKGIDANNNGFLTDTNDVTFTYDQENIRLNKSIVGGASTYFTNDPNNPTGYGQVLEESSTSGGSPTTTYTIGQDVIAQANSSGTVSYLMADGHGTNRGIIDSSAAVTATYDYDAFGKAIGFTESSQATKLLYAGEQFDSSLGQYYLRARYYDQGIGRFSSFDAFQAEADQAQQQHKYAYAGADPVNKIDPEGTFFSALAQLVRAGIDALLRGISLVGGFLVRQAAYALVRTQVIVYQAGLRVGIALASGGGAGLRFADRVAQQLRDPRLTTWAGQLTPNMVRQLATNPAAQRFADMRNNGNVQIIQRLPGMAQNVYLRITMAYNEPDKIISVGIVRVNQVANLISRGDYTPLP
ncbi:RHS repeat-associated core domain-containing protein [Fontivita pretiosa]|uniref:RHS repeat-associated core domain-containing protein n=1 Tax=Fontivita pretiosa TaxID=2989684 RepID=UPI003D183CF1